MLMLNFQWNENLAVRERKEEIEKKEANFF